MDWGTGTVLGLRVLWSVTAVAALIGLLPLGALSEFIRDLSRRGKLKVAPKTTAPPVCLCIPLSRLTGDRTVSVTDRIGIEVMVNASWSKCRTSLFFPFLD